MIKALLDIWILTETGLVVFNRVLDPKLDTQLFGGLMSALNSFAEKLDEGGLTNFSIMDKNYTIMKQNSFLFVANSEKKAKKVENELQWIIMKFFEMFGDRLINKWYTNIGFFQEFKTVIGEKDITANHVSLTKQKLEAISQIDFLKNIAYYYQLNGKMEEAIVYADEIMNLASKFNLPQFIQEQEDFKNSYERNIQKEKTIAKIEKAASELDKEYDKISDNEKLIEMHEKLNDFKKNYKDLPYFESIPLVQALLKKDIKKFIESQTQLKEK